MSNVRQGILYPSLDTPAMLIDIDRLEANIRRMSQTVANAGLKLRPHTKSHESPHIARLQIEAGAVGIASSKLSAAERMAEEGISDIMMVHPFYGDHKFARLKRLVEKPGLIISVVVDMIEQAQGISQVGEAVGKKVPVLLKIDSGLGRFGVLPGEPTLELARKVSQLPGVSLVGVLTHRSVFREKTREDMRKIGLESASVAAEAAKLLSKEGFAIRDVAVGCTATLEDVCDYYKKGYFPEVTEVHPGGGVLIDPLYINSFYGTEDDCAVTVLATVISTPAPNRAVLDIGAKTLSNDTLAYLQWKPDYLVDGRPSYGIVKDRPDLQLGRMSMEVSVVYPTNPEKRPTIGDRLEIVPNMVNIATNFQEKMYAVRKGEIEGEILLAGRGLHC